MVVLLIPYYICSVVSWTVLQDANQALVMTKVWIPELYW